MTRFSALLTVAFALPATLGLSAAAQESMLEMPAPSLAETEQAQPDWYQQFTFSSNDISSPVWNDEVAQSINLSWVKGDRWSVSVDLTSREDAAHLASSEEMAAGADFKITPRISVGGEVMVGTKASDSPQFFNQEEVETGIRLRSAFRF